MKTATLCRYLICLSVFGLTVPTQAQEIFSEGRGVYSTGILKMSLDCKDCKTISIRSAETLVGKLNIVVTEGDKVEVDYFKKAHTARKSDAIDYIDLISVSLSRTPVGARLDLRAPNPAPWTSDESGTVDLAIRIPAQCEVEIDARYFDIEGEGPFKTFLVPSSLGRLTVKNVTDKLELNTSNQRITINEVSGEIYAATSNSSLVATDIQAKDRKAVFRNEGGDIRIQGITAELDLRNSYGRTDVINYSATGKKNYIRSLYGPIMVMVTRMQARQLLVTNQHEDIELWLPEDLSSVISLAVEEDGKIEVTNMEFTPDLIQSNRLNLVAGGGDALISGSVRGKGNIFVRTENGD